MKILTNVRHGDLGLFGITTPPKGIKKSSSKVLLQTGSGGNPHSIDKGTFYPKEDGQSIGYLVAKGTKLFHVEHSPKGAKIPDGVYDVRRQREITHEGFREVID